MSPTCICGSCVTRDVWRVTWASTNTLRYFVRSRFPSALAPPVDLSEDDLAFLESAFQRPSIVEDAQKAFIPWCIAEQPAVIIIDLIDERFDLAQVGKSFLTEGFEYFEAKLWETKFADCPTLNRLTLTAEHFWRRAVLRFLEIRAAHFPATRLVLHKAWWATDYCSGHDIASFCGQHTTFRERLMNIAEQNEMISRYYSFFEDRCPGLEVLELPRWLSLGAATHAWGRNPVHYIGEYYRRLAQEMRRLQIL